jgi:hypothetical protein
MKLSEGLRRGDLNGMVLPLLSIDEFSSKIDDRTVIVVAFYSFEEDPAHDMSNFIERSPQNVLDTDVSPAPTREGYYVTFVEIKRDNQFINKLLHILQEVDGLTDVKQWQFTSQKLPKGKVLPVTKQYLTKWVDTEPKPDQAQKPDTQTVKEWFTESALHDVCHDEPHIRLIRAGVQHVYEVISLQDHAPDCAQLFTEQAVSQTRCLERLLDGPYTVWHMDDHLVVENHVRSTYLVIKPIN